jgi:hypothetical protein
VKCDSNKKRDATPKDTLHYVRNVFLFTEVAIKVTTDPSEQKHDLQDCHQKTAVYPAQ